MVKDTSLGMKSDSSMKWHLSSGRLNLPAGYVSILHLPIRRNPSESMENGQKQSVSIEVKGENAEQARGTMLWALRERNTHCINPDMDSMTSCFGRSSCLGRKEHSSNVDSQCQGSFCSMALC